MDQELSADEILPHQIVLRPVIDTKTIISDSVIMYIHAVANN